MTKHCYIIRDGQVHFAAAIKQEIQAQMAVTVLCTENLFPAFKPFEQFCLSWKWFGQINNKHHHLNLNRHYKHLIRGSYCMLEQCDSKWPFLNNKRFNCSLLFYLENKVCRHFHDTCTKTYFFTSTL